MTKNCQDQHVSISPLIFQFVDGALILYWLLLAPHDSDSSLYVTGVATALVCLVLPTLLITFFLVNKTQSSNVILILILIF